MTMDTADLLLETLRLRNGPSTEELRTFWKVADTAGLRELVTFEGASLWLFRRLRQLEVGDEGTIDQGFFTWLGRMARRCVAQNSMVHEHAEAVVEILDNEGVPHVLLKGNALHLATTGFPFADARATNDIDVLVQEADARLMEQHFLENGYDYQFPPEMTPADHYHIRPLTNDAGVPVELHFSTSDALPSDAAWSRFTSGAVHVNRRSTAFRIPSATELFWHGTTHGVFHNQHAFRLRYFLDAASILATDIPVDWAIIEPRLGSAEVPGRERTVAWLGTAAWLAGTEMPEQISREVPAFPLQRIMRWRLRVMRRFHLSGRMAEKLLDEGTRSEAGMPLTPAVKGKPLPLRIRRRTGAFMARVAYIGWRTAFGQSVLIG
jgi:hypothetical protein